MSGDAIRDPHRASNPRAGTLARPLAPALSRLAGTLQRGAVPGDYSELACVPRKRTAARVSVQDALRTWSARHENGAQIA